MTTEQKTAGQTAQNTAVTTGAPAQSAEAKATGAAPSGQTPGTAPAPQTAAQKPQTPPSAEPNYKELYAKGQTELNKWRDRALSNESGFSATMQRLDKVETILKGIAETAGLSEEQKAAIAKLEDAEKAQATTLRTAASAYSSIEDAATYAGLSPEDPKFDSARQLFKERKFDESVKAAQKASFDHLKSLIPTPEQIAAEKARLEAEVKQALVGAVDGQMSSASSADIEAMTPAQKIREGIRRLTAKK
jgi:hypothetical protein